MATDVDDLGSSGDAVREYHLQMLVDHSVQRATRSYRKVVDDVVARLVNLERAMQVITTHESNLAEVKKQQIELQAFVESHIDQLGFEAHAAKMEASKECLQAAVIEAEQRSEDVLQLRCDELVTDVTHMKVELNELKQTLRIDDRMKPPIIDEEQVEPDAALDERAPVTDVASEVKYTRGAVVSYEDAKKSCQHEMDLALGESAWEAVLLAWTPVTGLAGSWGLTMALVVNIWCQVLFCTLGFQIFANTEAGHFPEGIVDDANTWRVTEAHNPDRMDKMNWVSFGERVCNGDGSLVLGSSQVTLLDEISRYLRVMPALQTPQGVLLFILCSVLWYFTVVQELDSCGKMLKAIEGLPLARATKIVWAIEGRFELESLSIVRKLLMYGIIALRFGLACWLLTTGGLWLSMTSSLEDMILNAAALAFVLEFDELIFSAMAPVMTKFSISNMKPLRRSSGPIFQGLNMTPVVFCACGVIFHLMLYTQRVDVMVDRMEKVRSLMCDDNRSFVVQRNVGLGNVVVVATNPYGKKEKTIFDDVVHALKPIASRDQTSPTNRATCPATVTYSEFDFGQKVERDYHSNSDCNDFLSIEHSYLIGLQDLTRNFEATTCRDFENRCNHKGLVGNIVRQLCSKTCMCHKPNFNIWLTSGCAKGCLEKRHLQLNSPCKDTQIRKSNFLSKTMWKALLEALPNQTDFNATLFELVRGKGCEAFQFSVALKLFGPQKWMADWMCGRFEGTNNAMPATALQGLATFRHACPGSCGCAMSYSDECPDVCQYGARAEPINCSEGLCGKRMVLSRRAGADHLSSCWFKSSKMLSRRRALEQVECEFLARTFRDECCIPWNDWEYYVFDDDYEYLEQKLATQNQTLMDGDSEACSNTCATAIDNDCDDGGPGSDFSDCKIGTDCVDCGIRSEDELTQGEYEYDLESTQGGSY